MKGDRMVRCGGCGGWLATSSTACATCRQWTRQRLLVAVAGLDGQAREDERQLMHDVYADTLDEQQLADELARLRLAQ